MEPKGTLGPRLRQERERRQISLKSIAANTKINRSLLEALERDDVSRWPSGIFRRAFVRSYASSIGMDPEEIWKEFSERFPDPNPPLNAAAPSPSPAKAEALTEPHARGLVHQRHADRDGGRYGRGQSSDGHDDTREVVVDKGDRVEFVFRVSLPRSLASWALRLKSLAARVQGAHPTPRRQNM